jgi:subtilase family serine protease
MTVNSRTGALFGLSLGALLTAAGLAQGQPPATGASATFRQPAKHAAICPGPAAAGTARCHGHVVVDSSGQPQATSGPAGYSPSDLRGAYKVTGTGTSSTRVAIVDAYGYPNAESDLAVYRSQFGLLPCTTSNGCFKKVTQGGIQGSYPRTDTGWSQESALDLDMVSAMCPGCSILLVEANSSSYSDLALAVNTAAAMGAHVISNSYGGGEAGTSAYEPYYNYAGIAVTVSSGDSGYGVLFPASSPHVTAVGGTTYGAAAPRGDGTRQPGMAQVAAAAASTPSRAGRQIRDAPSEPWQTYPQSLTPTLELLYTAQPVAVARVGWCLGALVSEHRSSTECVA